MPYILIGILAIGLIFYFFSRQKNKSVTQGYLISTQGESEERIKNLNLDSASENASHILDPERLSIPEINDGAGDVEYKPDPEKDWIIHVKTGNDISFTTEQLFKIFDRDWRVNFIAADVYGYSVREKKWTYAIVGGDPDTYSQLQVGIDLVEIYDRENASYDTGELEKYITELKRKLNAFPIKLETDGSIEQAAARARQLGAMKNEFDIEAIILLKSEKSFNGRLAWDVLQSVGLTWGDGDLFHWNNEEEYGHEQHFSVWTTTDPTYFMPEDIKKGRMNPADLVFGFSIPRSADPKNVFAVMFDAVKYCQKRLGGTLLGKDGKPFDEEGEKKYLDELIEKMHKKGLVPGSDKACMIF